MASERFFLIGIRGIQRGDTIYATVLVGTQDGNFFSKPKLDEDLKGGGVTEYAILSIYEFQSKEDYLVYKNGHTQNSTTQDEETNNQINDAQATD